MFNRDLLRAASAPLVTPSLAALRPPVRLLAGCDWGATNDRSATVALGRYPVAHLNDGFDVPVFGVAGLKAWPPRAPLSDVVDEIVACPAHWLAVSSERNGIGEKTTQDLFKALAQRPVSEGGRPAQQPVLMYTWGHDGTPTMTTIDGRPYVPSPVARRAVTQRIAVVTSAELKAQTYGTLRYLMERGQFVLPADTELQRELANLRVELRATGSVGIEAKTGHDDLADALMIAMAPHKDREGQWRSILGRTAELGGADAWLPETEREIVVTGGGLRVPRRPVLQSVAGPESLTPEALDAVDPLEHLREQVNQARSRRYQGVA